MATTRSYLGPPAGRAADGDAFVYELEWRDPTLPDWCWIRLVVYRGTPEGLAAAFGLRDSCRSLSELYGGGRTYRVREVAAYSGVPGADPEYGDPAEWEARSFRTLESPEDATGHPPVRLDSERERSRRALRRASEGEEVPVQGRSYLNARGTLPVGVTDSALSVRAFVEAVGGTVESWAYERPASYQPSEEEGEQRTVCVTIPLACASVLDLYGEEAPPDVPSLGLERGEWVARATISGAERGAHAGALLQAWAAVVEVARFYDARVVVQSVLRATNLPPT